MLAPCIRSAFAAAALAASAGCTPTLNWRDVSVDETGLLALFPCKPQRLSREASSVGVHVHMDLLSCKAGDWTFAVGHADVGRPDEASRALATMRSALLVNAGGRQTAAQAVSVPGMADDPAAQRIAVRGRNADGGPIEVQAQFFSHDGQVFQASVLGRGVVASDAAQTFFDGLHWLAERRS